MKKLIYLLIATAMLVSSCSKVKPQVALNKTKAENCVWVSPNGYVMYCSDKNNWQEKEEQIKNQAATRDQGGGGGGSYSQSVACTTDCNCYGYKCQNGSINSCQRGQPVNCTYCPSCTQVNHPSCTGC